VIYLFLKCGLVMVSIHHYRQTEHVEDWLSWPLKNDDQKVNANLNRLANTSFAFEVNTPEVEFAMAI